MSFNSVKISGETQTQINLVEDIPMVTGKQLLAHLKAYCTKIKKEIHNMYMGMQILEPQNLPLFK
jgi:hypothetical protein